MSSIKHLFHINTPREKVFKTLTTVDGIANWWTVETNGDAKEGGTLEFRFKNEFKTILKVTNTVDNEIVNWTCTGGPEDWINTKITFHLDDHDSKTRVRFEHSGWKEQNDFYAQCSYYWGAFMESLRQYCQKGIGEAFGSPNYRI